MNSPDEARDFVNNLCRILRNSAARRNRRDAADIHNIDKADGSPAKEIYGDAWLFFYGIRRGIYLIDRSRVIIPHEDNAPSGLMSGMEVEESGVSPEDWEEHYDTYGGGAYGRGLKLGKKLSTYNGEDFEFVEPDDEEPEFTFVE